MIRIEFFSFSDELLSLFIIISDRRTVRTYANCQEGNLIFLFVLLSIIAIQGQCSGGYWPIQDASIGSFTVFWRYNMASNTVQFIIQGNVYSMDMNLMRNI